MTITIITLTLILTNAACLIALACAIEGIGYWKQEAAGVQAAINRHVNSAYALEEQNMLLETENASLRAWKRQREGILARAVMGSEYVRPADSMLVRSEIAP